MYRVGHTYELYILLCEEYVSVLYRDQPFANPPTLLEDDNDDQLNGIHTVITLLKTYNTRVIIIICDKY